MLDKEEIKKQLEGKSGEQCAAFAVRAAMRVLPLLAVRKKQNSEIFWFWQAEDRTRYLLAVYQAYSCSVQCALDKSSGPANGTNTAANAACAADDVYADAYAYAAYAAYAANTAASAAHAANVNAANAYADANVEVNAYAYAYVYADTDDDVRAARDAVRIARVAARDARTATRAAARAAARDAASDAAKYPC